LSAKVAVVSGSSSVPEHDSSKDVGVFGVNGSRDGLQDGSLDVAFSGCRGRGRGTDDDLDVGVLGSGLSPLSPSVKVELAGVVVDSAVVVVELDKDEVEPAVGESSSGLGTEPVVGVRALRGSRNLVWLRGTNKVSSQLVDEVGISGGSSRFDVEIDTVEDSVSKGSNGSISSEEGVPHGVSESLSLGSGSESVIAVSAAHREEDLLSSALAVLDVRSNVRASK